jgi:hypothetical protein
MKEKPLVRYVNVDRVLLGAGELNGGTQLIPITKCTLSKDKILMFW